MRSDFKPVRLPSNLALLLCFFLIGCVPLSPDAETATHPPSPPLTAAPSAMVATKLGERACDLYIPAGEMEGETILCGYVRVPWDRSQPQGATIDLAYVILKATGGNPQPDPIIHVSGGPGLGATLRQATLEFIQRYAPLRADRDIILYDQRGMGHSLPFFSCPYPDEQQAIAVRERLTADLGTDPSDADVNNAFCQEGLAGQGYSPTNISTAASAADLVELMDTLGYEAYNLYGISYGTRLLMSLLHHFPEQANVRSVVLDSPYPLPEDQINDFSPLGHVAKVNLLQEVFDLCAGDPACGDAYPNLQAQFDTLVQSLASQPLSLPDGSDLTVEQLYRSIFPFNQTVGYVAYQPRLIVELAQGDTTTFMQLRNGEVAIERPVTALGEEHPRAGELVDAFLACEMDWSDEALMAEQGEELVKLWDADPSAIRQFLAKYCLDGSDAPAAELVSQLPEGVFNNVIVRFAPDTIMGLNAQLNSKLKCTEQYPFAGDPAKVGVGLTEAGAPTFWVEKTLEEMTAQAEGCAGWADALAAPTPAAYGETSVLILNGQLDANTPPAYGEVAAAQLPQARLIIVPSAGHSILGNHGDCPTTLVEQFLARPDQEVDAGCTADMQIQFVIQP
jgi:pimeloyl-ACP methyl ester carboxylesterase